MTPGKKLTIREVAEAAGVSTQTVSRVLNNRPDVAPETFARVQQVISETGYSPNMLARSLTQGRSHILGVVAYGLEYFGPSRVLAGIEQQAAAMGYSITLNLIHDPEAADVDTLLAGLFGRQVDGVIWTVPGVGNNRYWLERQKAFPVPVVLVGGVAGPSALPAIGIDNRAIGCMATEHLLAGGASHVGIITGPMNWWEARQREIGWRETLAANGIRPEECFVETGDWTPGSGEEAFGRLLGRCPDLDAVFASNDQMALGVLHAAHKYGRRIPEEISVVGVDNIDEASHFWPSLTTVHQPLGDVGALAVEQLYTAIKGIRSARRPVDVGPVETVLVPPSLIIRESSRPATVASRAGSILD